VEPTDKAKPFVMMGRNATGIPPCSEYKDDKSLAQGGIIMLSVTTTAKEKFGEVLQTRTTDPEIAIRIISSPSKPNTLELVLDKEKEGDQVVKTEEGKKVLLIGTDLMPALEEVVIDYKQTNEGTGFTISKPAPSS
jgi:Fe-S cluster assembly iron-binding protein IscA